jgi:MATE family multidrug resistance protein
VLCVEENFKKFLATGLTFSKKQIAHVKLLVKFGWPLALQYGGEIAVLTVATYFIGQLDYRYLAAQQVSSQFRIISMMIPFGIAQASSIMVSRELAVKNNSQAYEVGCLAFKLGLMIMIISSLLCVIFADKIIALYISKTSANQSVITLAKFFLYVAAVSQLFDTIKIISGGILRGYGDTLIPMALGLFSLALIGLPLGYYLGYWTKLGAIGIPLGLLIGFIFSAVLLMTRTLLKVH